MELQYMMVNRDGVRNLTLIDPDTYEPHVVYGDHPQFDRIVQGCMENDPSVIDLFNMSQVVAEHLEHLSERVAVAGGNLYFDGDIVHNALADQVVRFLREGEEDWMPLVNFFENISANPETHSREQLYEWLARREFTITPGGMIVGYKGVARAEGGGYQSIHAGTAIVDGEMQTGHIHQALDSVVEMPRSTVQHDPSEGCSVGLHVGTYDYANSYGNVLLEVHVNPRDVVSVPTDSNAAKVRCCRYTVIREVEKRYTSPIVWDGEDDDDYDYYG